MVDVVFCTDAKYLPHCATAIASLLENEPRTNRVFVISLGVDPFVLTQFQDHVRATFGKDVTVFEADRSQFDQVFTSGHITAATYLRFLVPEILPQEVSFVLYLDSDVIVNSSFSDILPNSDFGCISLDGPAVWAVAEDGHNHLEEAGFRIGRYFNAGVMYLDLRRWRSEKITQKLLAAEKLFRGKLKYWDQDVLNIVLANSWREMSPWLNGTKNSRNGLTRIVHFTSNRKPWHFAADNYERRLYARYRRKTLFWPFRLEWNLVTFLAESIPGPIFSLLKRTKRTLSKFKLLPP